MKNNGKNKIRNFFEARKALYSNKKLLVVLMGLIFASTAVGLSYAWLSRGISGFGKQFSVTTARLGVLYTDGPEISTPNILPGTTIAKTFTVKNTSEETAIYEIYLKDYKNTFVNDELVYTLEEEAKGELITETALPLVLSEEDSLVNKVSISPGEIHYYTLTIKFIETGSNQNHNLKASFSGTLQIRESSGSDLELAITIDGVAVDNLPKGNYYNLVTSTCDNNSVIEWMTFQNQIYIKNANLPEKCSLEFETIDNSLLGQVLANNTLKTGTVNYGVAPTTAADTGLYKAQDDYGDSYYFRGNKNFLNNNVIFGGYQWKIIRITGLGDIKLIYNGVCSSLPCTINDQNANTHTSIVKYNVTMTNKYVGYMYGNDTGSYEEQHANTTNSTIKTAVDTWYNSKLSEASKSIISDTIYCNDRSLISGNGTGSFATLYGAFDRIYTNKKPKLVCPQKKDSFTVNDKTKGNGDLTYPIGLITADEILMAGGITSIVNSTSYLNTGQGYWSMSPMDFSESGVASVLVVTEVGSTNNLSINRSLIALRPVIALKSNVQISGGNGSSTTPYIITY